MNMYEKINKTLNIYPNLQFDTEGTFFVEGIKVDLLSI